MQTLETKILITNSMHLDCYREMLGVYVQKKRPAVLKKVRIQKENVNFTNLRIVLCESNLKLN